MAAVTLSSRIPEFWTDQPDAWFCQMESTIAPQKLSDKAKFDLVVSKAGKQVIVQIRDLVRNPPADDKFGAVKERLMDIYQESETRQLQRLMGEMELGDQRPTQLLRRMRNLATDRMGDDTLRILWQNLLPPEVRGVLAVTDTHELDRLAVIADKVMETSRPIGSIAEVQQRSPQQADPLANVLAEVAKISLRLAELESGRPRRGPLPRQRSRSRSKSRERTMSKRRPDWQCFYHFRFKEDARKCIPPCSWKPAQGN